MCARKPADRDVLYPPLFRADGSPQRKSPSNTPLLSSDCSHPLSSDGRLQQEALQHLIQLLPTPNRETLWNLLNFLVEVAAHSEDQESETGEWVAGNKMDIANLATVFAPNILHCVKRGRARSEVSIERAEERIDVINVMRALLEHASTIFTVPASLLDELYLHMMDSHPTELDLALSRRAEKQCTDEIDPCSEAETFSVEKTVITSTATRKVWSREQCLHQFAGIGADIGPRPRRPTRTGSRREEKSRSNSVDSGSSEDPGDPRRQSSPMVITASLTIPVSSAFTLNLDDWHIPYIEEAQLKQHHQQQQPSASPGRQRQRYISDCSEGGRHGSDSAVGSSATMSGDQPPSSPPSWASSPPASPDSAITAVSDIPDQQAVLQKVSFATSSEVPQFTRSNNQEALRATLSAPYTPSITSIGGAVMRSKTADIERMLHIIRPEVTASVKGNVSSMTSSDSKKYTKTCYTDSTHQTRHIPEVDAPVSRTSSTSMSSSSISSMTFSQSTQSDHSVPIWKRRVLISSAPKNRDGYF